MVFRRSSRRRMSMPRAIVQSYKKVLNEAGSTRVGSTSIVTVVATGVDSIAAGQTSVADANVPTGCVIKYFEIQWSYANPTAGVIFLHTTIQKTHSTQAVVGPNVVGGNPQRNQVFHQSMRAISLNQNGNAVFRFKVPKQFQRMREGDNWKFVRIGDAAFTDAVQIIYKFYR